MTSTADIRRIFVDSSAWISLIYKHEERHAIAVSFHKSLTPLTLYITTWGVVSETFTWIRYHVGGDDALRWLAAKERQEQQGVLQVVFPVPQMEVGIRNIIGRFHDQDLSYVDAHSIAVVRSRPDIDAIFAFDHHMALTGLPVLPGPLGGRH